LAPVAVDKSEAWLTLTHEGALCVGAHVLTVTVVEGTLVHVHARPTILADCLVVKEFMVNS